MANMNILNTTLGELVQLKDYENIRKLLKSTDISSDEFYDILYKTVDTAEVDENLTDILLNNKKIDINHIVNSEDHTILHCVAYHGHVNVLNSIFKLYEDVRVDSRCKKGRTPLMMAAMKNQVEVLEILQTNHANIDQQDNQGWGALHYASCTSFQGRLPAVRKLIELGVDVNKWDVLGQTPLMKAAKKCLREIVAVLLKSGANANIKCKEDNTPLDCTVKKWHVDCIKLLIDKSENLDKVDKQGKTLLMKAANVGEVQIITCLLARGVNVNLLCNKRFSALNYALINGHLGCIKMLLKHTNLNSKDGQGQTLLIKAAGFGQDEILSYILESLKNINVNEKCFDNRSALDYAAWSGHLKCVEILIKHGADVESKDRNGQTPLMKAAGFGHIETVEFLLKAGAEVENACSKKRTALNYACYNGKLYCAKKLIEYNADIHTIDDELQTPLIKAAEFGNDNLVEYLITLGADAKVIAKQTNALGFAARNGSLGCVKLLLQNGADINYKSTEGLTPLMEASIHDNFDIIEYLLGSTINIDDVCDKGRTALVQASYFGHLKSVEVLLQHGANIHHRDIDGETALYKAVGKHHCDVVKYLLENKAQVNENTPNGSYILIDATLRGCLKCVMNVVKYGAKIDVQCKKNEETALFTAIWHNHPEIAAFLLKEGADIYRNNSLGWDVVRVARSRCPYMLDIIKKYRRIIC